MTEIRVRHRRAIAAPSPCAIGAPSTCAFAGEQGAGNGAVESNGAERRSRRPGHARLHAGAPCALASPGLHGTGNGAPDGAPNGALWGAPIGAAWRAVTDAQTVMARLEEAGRALLALPQSGPSTALRLNATAFIRMALLGGADEPGAPKYDEPARLRPAVPDAARITRMDEALAWIPLIPRDRYVLRRVVGCRALVHPLTDRHVYPWRRIGLLLGADHKAVQRWHAQGIDLIVAALNVPR